MDRLTKKTKNSASLDLLHSTKTVVLVIDVQNAYCSRDGTFAKLGYRISRIDAMVSRLAGFVKQANKANVPVIFTKMIEDPRLMAENARIKMAMASTPPISSPNTKGFELYKIRPSKKDHIIVKKSYDAFSNKQLLGILRKQKAKTLIITGVLADVCVDSTVRSAFTKGFNVIIPEDLVETIDTRSPPRNLFDVWNKIFAHITTSVNITKEWSRK